MADTNMDIDTDTTVDEILLASTNHDIETLQKLLQTETAKVQDPETGYSPLHAAIASCEADEELTDADAQNAGDAVHSQALSEESALETVKLLLENGAIWNELDHNDETPGCIALRLGLKKVYAAIVDAGVRAELLFGRLDLYELLGDGQDDNDEEDEVTAGESNDNNGLQPPQTAQTGTSPTQSTEASATVPTVVQTDDQGQEHPVAEPSLSNPNVNNEDYLKSKLSYSGDRLLDSDKNAVMMDWETEIMKVSADQLCPRSGLRTMNVGHGMGIVDAMFLANDPAMHYIVEAHPEVQQKLRREGWHEKPNVTVCEGRWQDVLPKLIAQGVVLDGIYYDTYAEDYKDLKEFFTEYVIQLMDQKGKFGFYNGLGADRQVCYDVYTKVVELDLFDAGMDVEWTDLSVPDLKGRDAWNGIRYPYWNVETYRLPTCKFVG